MEIGWHLRYSKRRELEFILKPDAVDIAREAAFIASEWEMRAEKSAQRAVVRFTRKTTS